MQHNLILIFPFLNMKVRKFHSNYYHEKLSLKVQRDRILESSMKATKNFSISDWCGNLEITFLNEQGKFYLTIQKHK